MAARKRIDPTSRPADGFRPIDVLRNADPNRHYVFANPNDDFTGVEYYSNLGYDVEKKRADGPKPAIGKTVGDGEAITVHGQILMSCPKELFSDRSGAGQEIADALERRIRRPDKDVAGRHGVPGAWGAVVGVDPRANGEAYVEKEA